MSVPQKRTRKDNTPLVDALVQLGRKKFLPWLVQCLYCSDYRSHRAGNDAWPTLITKFRKAQCMRGGAGYILSVCVLSPTERAMFIASGYRHG